MEDKSKERSNEINLLKFAALVLVILIHDRLPGIIGTIIRGIAAMAVPVYFMISGYFGYGVSVKTIRKRMGRIFSLMILANCLYFLWDVYVELLSGRSLQMWLIDNCSLKRILVFLLTNESSLRGHLWFLGALLYAYLFITCLMWWKERKNFNPVLLEKRYQCIFTMSACLLFVNIIGGELLTQCGKNIQIPYLRNWLFCGVPFFCIGYCIHAKEKQIEQYISRQKLWMIFLFAIALNIAEVFWIQESELYLTTILVSITVFLSALHYQGRLQSRLPVLMGKLADRYGLWIYILQIMVIKNIKWFASQYALEDSMVLQWLRPFASFFITLLLSMLLVWVLENCKRMKRICHK